ncbi:MAG: hypothetical protein WC796_04050 [Candidatus Pacearchaeota archaeon]|jgi:hypothetical protein
MNGGRLIFILVISLFLILNVNAHQPRLVFDNSSSAQTPFPVYNPEVSQAFYGELKGNPDYYSIDSNSTFQLYLGILSPVISNTTINFSAEVYFNNNLIYSLNGNDFNWSVFYEEFGGDNYFKGPEFDRQVIAGSYLVKVSGKDNQGKYVLAVGKKEKFPLGEMIHTVVSLPKLKKDFFGKSVLTSYFNILGFFMLVFVIIFLAILLVVVLIIGKLKESLQKNKCSSNRN